MKRVTRLFVSMEFLLILCFAFFSLGADVAFLPKILSPHQFQLSFFHVILWLVGLMKLFFIRCTLTFSAEGKHLRLNFSKRTLSSKETFPKLQEQSIKSRHIKFPIPSYVDMKLTDMKHSLPQPIIQIGGIVCFFIATRTEKILCKPNIALD